MTTRENLCTLPLYSTLEQPLDIRVAKVCADDQCEQRGKVQPPEAFGTDIRRKDGTTSYCRKCRARQQREWKQKHPEKVAEWNRRSYERIKAANLARIAQPSPEPNA